MSDYYSQKVNVFHGRETPEDGYIVGYALLIKLVYSITQKAIPMPKRLSIVTDKHQRYNTEDWQVFTKRHKPKSNISSHLSFALKHEGVDLYILKTVFNCFGEDPVLYMLKNQPTGQYSRRIWFLYEWLMDKELGRPGLKTGSYVDIVNSSLQYVGPSTNSTRHRIKNNLPGNRSFCPMIYRTDKLEEYISKGLSGQIEKGLSQKNKDLIRRTAAFLLLKDSKASFAIEGENPPNIRARNWGKAIGQAGKKFLSIDEIERLQDIVIGSKKLKEMGIRKSEGFIGEHDRETFEPIPDHISAKAEDLSSLLDGLITTNYALQKSNMDPVLIATAIAFGFVFIHPLSDGNGRIHRYIIHHVLAKTGYTKGEMIFPISAAILNRMGDYQNSLEDYANSRLELIDWKSTPDHHIKIFNETIDLYRYFDLTQQAEFLYECVEETIENIIPEELDYLEKYDRLNQQINLISVLPDNKVDLLIKILIQNNGKLSKRKREKEFGELTDREIAQIEKSFTEIF